MRWVNITRRTASLVLIVFAISLGGCTTTTVTPEFASSPRQEYQVVAIGDVTAEDKLWDYLVPFFRNGLIERFNDDETFTTVQDPATHPLPHSAILLSGKITGIDRGSKALRAIIGFGAGRARVRGTFEIQDAQGIVLASFASRKAYSGGAGIGGWDLVDMEDLMHKFGTETANSVIRWSQGGSLD